jgi:hypothetical protein
MDSGIMSDDSLDLKLNESLICNNNNNENDLTITSSISSLHLEAASEVLKGYETDEPIFPVMLLSNSTRKEDTHAVFCDYCKKNNFTEYRYKCLICDDFDLCGTCFERRTITSNHQLEHPMVRYEKPNELFGIKFENSEINLDTFSTVFMDELHNHVSCDGCSMSPIKVSPN